MQDAKGFISILHRKNHLYVVFRNLKFSYYSSTILDSLGSLLFLKLSWHIGLTPNQAYVYYYAIKPSNYSFQKFKILLKSPIIFKINYSHKKDLIIIHSDLLINTDNYIQLQITTLNRHENAVNSKNILKCSHRNKKYLIVSLSLNQ